MEIVVERELPVDQIKVHPQIHQLYGETRPDEYARLEENIRQRGIVMRLEVASEDSPVFGGFLVDGEQRLKAARAIGLDTVPVRIRRFSSPADVMLLLYALAARKSYTDRQRAEQEHALRQAIEKQPAAWKAARGFASGRVNDMIAEVVQQSPEGVRRRKKVFYSETSTPSLKAAVEVGQIPLRTAEEILRDAERAYAPGSREARKAVNRAVDRHQNYGKKRHKRAPRHHAFDAKAEDARVFWSRMQEKILAWAAAEAGIQNLRREDIRSILFEEAMKAFRSDVSCAVADLKRSIRRIAGAPSPSPSFAGHDVRKDLALLGVPPPRRGERLDVAAIKKAYWKRARETHPDLTSNPAMNKLFLDYQAAYERLSEVARQQAA